MNFDLARFNLIEQQIRPWGVLDPDVLALLKTVHREDFVAPEQAALAFADLELPLGHGEAMWTPKMEARVLQALALTGRERVLEVGTGSGHFTALLAHRAASVLSVEIDAGFARSARERLDRLGYENIEVVVGDAAHGWPRGGPFDAIVFTGALPVLPLGLAAQLAPKGKVFAIVGDAPVMKASCFDAAGLASGTGRVEFETLVKPLFNAPQARRFQF